MYNIVKHAQLGLVRSLAAEYAEANLQVNAVSPSMLDTKFLKGLPKSLVEGTAASMPGKRNVQVSEVVHAISYLLAPEGRSMTGIEIPVARGSVT
jgi:3-oxoacyl-[acyl-carrier protein] reductase